MEPAVELVASVLLTAGAALTLIAAIGLVRFPDVFCRMHAATKPATLGLILILTGTILALPRPGVAAKIALVILLQFVTAPVGAHLIGRAAYRRGAKLAPGTTIDPESQHLRTGT